MNFEQLDNNKIGERNLEINLDEKTRDFVNIKEEDILAIEDNVNEILGSKWDMSSENIKYYSFSERQDFENFIKEEIPESKDLLKESALFYINPETQERIVLKCASIPSAGDIKTAENNGYSPEEIAKNKKLEILSAFAHEVTHMHPFFKKHGNAETGNMWEQELICSYVGERIINKANSKKLISNKDIDSFNLSDGEWESKKSGGIINYFYPFLIKEYGIDMVRNIWKRLQVNPNINLAIKDILKQSPENVEKDFKAKMKNFGYLDNIFN